MKNGNNQVTLTGRIATEFKLCYQYGSEKFYKMEIVVKRFRENVDWIPVVVSDWLDEITQDYTEQFVEIHGEFRSHNCHEEMQQSFGTLCNEVQKKMVCKELEWWN